MLINAAVAGFAVPALHTQRHWFVIGQALFLSIALGLWYLSWRRYITE
jgi:elongation factor P hydroxylase